MSHAYHIHRERVAVDALLRIGDAGCILTGFLAASQYPTAQPLGAQDWLAAAVAVVLFSVLGEFTGLYGNWRGVATVREVTAALLTGGYTLLLLLSLGFLTRYTDQLPRGGLAVGVGTVALLLASLRITARGLQRWWCSRGHATRHFAVVGVNDLGIRLARSLELAPELGLRLLGFYDDRPLQRTGRLPPEVGTRLGKIQQLVEQARRGEVDRIYITLPMRAEKRTRELLSQLADTTASVYIVPDFFVFELLHSRWTDINGLPVVSVFESPFYGVDGLLKRFCDVVVAGLLVLLAGAPMLLIAALIKATSPGPVFFRQKRYGLDGREILVWKFRSMRVCEPGSNFTQATREDPRVTPIGRLIRKTSLDELPQLFNVLEGTMSLVGPRPHATAQNEHYRRLIQGYMLRHKVKPGITGLAQVLGWRGETDTLDKMANRIQCDLRYIREWSLWLDIKILVRTILVVIKGQNAY
jgi:putative colanic acid biosynthesis UDP-glucose lipid carrier transferase